MIQLSAAVSQNLNSLQATADMMSQVQNRLATGLKVTSALDNPNSYFTAQTLNNRSSDMSALLDDMGQAIQTLKAADEGITSISKLVEAAKAKANQAQQTSDTSARRQFAKEYNEILTQIEGIAQDAGYNGKNLIGGLSNNNLTVKFNENGTNDITIKSVDYTDSTSGTYLGLADQTAQTDGTDSLASGGTIGGGVKLTVATHGIPNLADGDVLTLSDGVNSTTLTVGAGTDYDDLVDAFNTLAGGSAVIDAGDDEIDFTSTLGDVTIISDDAGGGTMTDATGSADYVAGSFDTDALIATALTSLTDALASLRSQASTFGTNLTVVENRQRFTNAMISTLQEGAGKLVLADTNQEGANLLALQTRQQLASTSLSFASQADQNVLRLF